MKKGIYISYDLSVEGDYESLFRWLDQNNAKECGEGLAFLNINLDSSDIITQLKTLLKTAEFKPKKNDRLYAIYRDNKDHKIKGDFIFGSRKRAAWEGFYILNQMDNDTDIIE